VSGAQALDPAARLQHALELAYRYLGHRDRTVAELRTHLERHGVAPATGEEAIAELAEQRYLDDAGFARRFAEDRRGLDGWGAERIARRLAALGVDQAEVEAALDGLGGDELAAAVEVLRRRVRTAPADDRARERALGVLARRGYDLDVAHEAIRRFGREVASGSRM
jgi:regulatory protein